MSEPEEIPSHHASLAVWDVASPVVIGRQATLKVGVACPCGCDLAGARIDVYDESGARVGGGETGSELWPATLALYWTQLDVNAPAAEGEHAWSVEAIARDPSHGRLAQVVRFIASRPPEHRVTLEVVEQASRAPVGNVDLRLGPFRASTDEAGIAHVEVPRGTYDVCAWKVGYALLSTTADVAGDATIRLEVATASQPEQPYWA